MINKKGIVNKDDRLLFSKVADKIELCEIKHKKVYTDFLPIAKYNEFLLISKAKKNVNIGIFGGFSDAERVIIGVCPSYDELLENKYPISVLEIKYNKKYSKELTHRDFLGSIMGQGIDRCKIGDIILEDDKAVCFVTSDIKDYLAVNLEKVASSKVDIKALNIEDYDIPIKKFDEKKVTVASVRLDTTLGAVFNISRNNINKLIKSEKAFVNFSVEQNISKALKEGDIVTLRGYGRIKIHMIGGKTKKDRIILTVLKYI